MGLGVSCKVKKVVCRMSEVICQKHKNQKKNLPKEKSAFDVQHTTYDL